MLPKLLLVSVVLEISCSADLYPDDEDAPKSLSVTLQNLEFEPVVNINKDKEKTALTKNLNCEQFPTYAMNCTLGGALIYNSSRKSPPMPAKMNDWCRALRHLTNCAIDWNIECKEVTDSHFNEESIKGHMHVVDNVCDDEWFLSRYDEIPQCIESTTHTWEGCYTTFKNIVDRLKNSSHEWTHYVTHFYLCCARTQFRRCTLDSLFSTPVKCEREHAITLQKFTVIVSEGDVFQDCDHSVVYDNCPGGDPRPNEKMVGKLMSVESYSAANMIFENTSAVWYNILLLMCLIK